MRIQHSVIFGLVLATAAFGCKRTDDDRMRERDRMLAPGAEPSTTPANPPANQVQPVPAPIPVPIPGGAGPAQPQDEQKPQQQPQAEPPEGASGVTTPDTNTPAPSGTPDQLAPRQDDDPPRDIQP